MTATSGRRGAPLAVIAAVALVPVLALTGVWQYADANVPPPTTTTTTTEPPPPDDELTTPLLSFRRHPTPLAERIAAEESAAVFDAWTRSVTDTVGAGSCVRVVDGETVVAEVEPTLPLIPASNMKLLPAAVALEVMGPDFVYRTELQSARPQNGVIPGDVYLVGGGDPVLRTADVPDPLTYPAFNTTALEPLADQLVTLGVTRIEGALVGDGSRYDDEFRAPTWGDGITNRDAGPYDALLVNDALIENGNYGLEPNRAAAVVFAELVTARGIEIAGGTANRARPADADLTTLALIESRPLIDILVELLHTSDNNTAEMLVKEIGFQATGQGTRQAGLDTIRATLERWGVPTQGLELHDGSGLSRSNRTTCSTLTGLLSIAPVADELVELLPVAGRDGTLADELVGTPADGALRAKTGTLRGVKALSGTQPGADRREVDFAVVLNGDGVAQRETFEPIWERIVELIDEYPTVIEADVEQFAPR
jgi:D-alanyl-D-alanine carboxypeptidase/D-alanyl-D-alanine-endopeptidase (penicillin-binding protein 4)